MQFIFGDTHGDWEMLERHCEAKEAMEEIYYCKCCGYQMQVIPNSNCICEVCY